MNASDFSVYLTLIGGLFFGPLLAFGIYAALQSNCPSATRPGAVISAAAFIVVLGAAILNIGFRDVTYDVAFLIIAYTAYSFLAVCCLRIPPLSIRVLALAIAAIPVGVGYYACTSTTGRLGLAFIVGDYTQPPRHLEQMRADLTCRVFLWGYAFSDTGYTVRLYKSWTWLPLVERSVVTISVNETNDANGPVQPATCADALGKYLE